MITVNDIGIAAFIRVVKNTPYEGMPFKESNDRHSKFIFKFNITDEQLKAIQVEYMNSDFRKFDQEIKDLKKVLNQY